MKPSLRKLDCVYNYSDFFLNLTKYLRHKSKAQLDFMDRLFKLYFVTYHKFNINSNMYLFFLSMYSQKETLPGYRPKELVEP